jgi:hypothetical protein
MHNRPSNTTHSGAPTPGAALPLRFIEGLIVQGRDAMREAEAQLAALVAVAGDPAGLFTATMRSFADAAACVGVLTPDPDAPPNPNRLPAAEPTARIVEVLGSLALCSALLNVGESSLGALNDAELEAAATEAGASGWTQSGLMRDLVDARKNLRLSTDRIALQIVRLQIDPREPWPTLIARASEEPAAARSHTPEVPQ